MALKEYTDILERIGKDSEESIKNQLLQLMGNGRHSRVNLMQALYQCPKERRNQILTTVSRMVP
jgi:hypothetical protein